MSSVSRGIDLVPDVNDFMPASLSDCVKFLFLLFCVFTTFVFEFTTVIPNVFPDNRLVQAIHMMNGLYILHLILGNLYLFIRTETSIRNVVLSTSLNPGWRFCSVCESNCPPRSFHCSSCSVCILRRDHHCEFAGKCLGYKNYRYFLGFLYGLILGSGYSMVLNQYFIWDELGGFSFMNLLKHIFPWIFMLLGKMPFSTGVYCFISGANHAGGFLFCSGLFLYHSSLMIKNQTCAERNRGITDYDLGSWKINIQEVLGENYIRVFLSPFASSPLPRDGISFPTRQEYSLTARKER